jgi:hypothetical protein
MQLFDVLTPPRTTLRRDGAAEQYGSLLELLLDDPKVAAWLESYDAETMELGRLELPASRARCERAVGR